MKTILILAIAAISITAAPATTKACDTYRTVTYCRPYVVCTEVVSRCRERRTGYDSCGRCFYYWVTVVNYRDVYSDGFATRYTRTFRD